MKLLFDARWIRTDFHDGVSRYTTEIANALAKQTEVTFIISDLKQLHFLPENAAYIKFQKSDSLLEPFASLKLNFYKPDVVYSPMQTMGSLGRKFKLILTLHDMTYYKHRLPPPQAKGIIRPIWRLFYLFKWPQRIVLNRADVVATVSQTAKTEIEAARMTKRPLIVVSNAARDLTEYLKEPAQLAKNPPKNLIFMSTLLPYKNAETLIAAMEFLPGRRLHLLSKVSDARRAALESLVPKGADVVFHNGVSDGEYANLLADDALMVSASKSEGFGLPLAEALMLGVPAVVSDLPFYHEIAGPDGAIYIDPEDPESVANGVLSLDSLAARKKVASSGHEHVLKFNWDDSAATLLSACKKLLRK